MKPGLIGHHKEEWTRRVGGALLGREKKNWEKILSILKTSRYDPRDQRFRKDPSRTSIHNSNRSPCSVSLFERSSEFKYDAMGLKIADVVGLP
jgi:hypothetical protein